MDLLVVAHAPFVRVNRRVYREIVRRGWRVEIVIPEVWPFDQSGRRPDPAVDEDPPLHLLPVQGKRLRYWRFRGLYALLASRCPQIVLLENDPDSLLAWEIGRWTRANGAHLVCQSNENALPSVLTSLRNLEWKHAARRLRSRTQLLLTRRTIDHVFAISEAGRTQFAELLSPDRVTRIPLGFDEDLFRPDAAVRAACREELGLTTLTFAYFGRLAQEKGIHLLVAALSGILDQEWELLLDRFDLESAYARELQAQLASTGVLSRTKFFEASHEEMPKFMNSADVVVVPSLVKEQYGRVVPEAMACGCLVIASRIGALPELVGPYGRLVPPGDVRSLETSLRTALHDFGSWAAGASRERCIEWSASMGLRRQADAMCAVFSAGLSTAVGRDHTERQQGESPNPAE